MNSIIIFYIFKQTYRNNLYSFVFIEVINEFKVFLYEKSLFAYYCCLFFLYLNSILKLIYKN